MFMRYHCWQTFCDVMLITGVRMGDMSCVISGLVLIQIAVDIEAYNKCETLLKYRYFYKLYFHETSRYLCLQQRSQYFSTIVTIHRRVLYSTFVFSYTYQMVK